MSKPRLFVVAAPSGGGKTSLVTALLERDQQVTLSVSHTTRSPRPGETDGVHYHFVDHERFLELVENDAFLEYARVYDHYYGTSRQAVNDHLSAGFDVLLDIDWQGARQIKESFPDCCTIFIIPPSIETLRRRLTARGQDSSRVIERRMTTARDELSHGSEFDYLVVNDDFDRALKDLHRIIRSKSPDSVAEMEKNHALLARLLEES